MIEAYLPSDEYYFNNIAAYLNAWDAKRQIKLNRYGGELIWINEIGHTLFWPWDTIASIRSKPYDISKIRCQYAVFSNQIPTKADLPQVKRFFPSFYWSRSPGKLEALSRHRRSYSERSIDSMFVARTVHPTQRRFRDVDYSDVISLFHVAEKDEPYLFTQEEFYSALGNSRFSLSLRGFGPKCNREIESLALGSVLMVNKEVDTSGYSNPLEEGKHFLAFETKDDLARIQRETSEDTWESISHAGHDWYQENCTFDGAFRVFKHIVEQCS